MIADALVAALEEIPGLVVRPGEPMRRHTVLRVGGPADLWLVAETETAAMAALSQCRVARQKVHPWSTAEVVVRDGSLPGVWLALGGCARRLQPGEDGRVAVGAAYPVAALAGWARGDGRTVSSELLGRSGTVGTAFSEGLLGELPEMVRVLRGSKVVDLEPDAVLPTHQVVSLTLAFPPETPRDARKTAARLASRTWGWNGLPGQVVGDANKMPAAEGIADTGLCRVRLRRARVGLFEPNSVINLGGASTRDVLLLVRSIRDRVKKQLGIDLQPRRRPIGKN